MIVDCPECGGDANITTDNDGEKVLECLQTECLHWEYK